MSNAFRTFSFFLLGTVMAVLLISGCSKADEDKSEGASPQIQVRDILQRTTTGGKPFVKVTIKNTGALTAYTMAATVNVVNGDVILASVAGDITSDLNPADLTPGAIAILTATFNTLSSHAEYTDLEFQFSWLEERTQIGAVQSIRVPRSEMEEE